MTQDETAIVKALDEVFHQATMEYVMGQLRRPEDFTRVREITQQAAAERAALEKEFQDNFAERVEAERIRLLEATKGRPFNHPAPPGMPRNTSYSIEQTARRNVLLSHEGDLQRVDWATNRAISDLMHQVRSRDARHGDAMRDFNEVNDRRSGEDRRAQSPTGPTRGGPSRS